MYEDIHACVHMNQMWPRTGYGIIPDLLVLQHKKYTYAPDVAKHRCGSIANLLMTVTART